MDAAEFLSSGRAPVVQEFRGVHWVKRVDLTEWLARIGRLKTDPVIDIEEFNRHARLNLEDAAEHVGVTFRRMKRLIHNGGGPPVEEFVGQRFVRLDELNEFMTRTGRGKAA